MIGKSRRRCCCVLPSQGDRDCGFSFSFPVFFLNHLLPFSLCTSPVLLFLFWRGKESMPEESKGLHTHSHKHNHASVANLRRAVACLGKVKRRHKRKSQRCTESPRGGRSNCVRARGGRDRSPKATFSSISLSAVASRFSCAFLFSFFPTAALSLKSNCFSSDSTSIFAFFRVFNDGDYYYNFLFFSTFFLFFFLSYFFFPRDIYQERRRGGMCVCVSCCSACCLISVAVRSAVLCRDAE